jgi:hypothetical protein
MWVYRAFTDFEAALKWGVGYLEINYNHVSDFREIEILDNKEDAQKLVHYLNGGN